MLACITQAEIIDRLAVTLDSQVITESDLRREIRLTSFLNGELAVINPARKREAADRLVAQVLLKREMQITLFTEPPASIADAELKEILQAQFGNNETKLNGALKEYGITREDIKERLHRQQSTIRFITLRFKPEIQVSEGEIRNYYDNRFLPEIRKRNINPEPSFDEARSECEDALIEERVDTLVERWLKEARNRVQIRYREDAFK